jgi:hypothetical protein
VSDLRLAFIKILNLKAQQVAGAGEAETVRVELSRNRDMPRPLSNMRVEMLFSRILRSSSAT